MWNESDLFHIQSQIWECFVQSSFHFEEFGVRCKYSDHTIFMLDVCHFRVSHHQRFKNSFFIIALELENRLVIKHVCNHTWSTNFRARFDEALAHVLVGTVTVVR
ncbi:Uncharacterised protein [Vibrio cholerae]|nr:Uncharacterised protein [Vibrio cholerae]CSB27742.1 Uncharacterised protein [Vibrio cholerae]CSB52281.1 Uncharacterised protein [Vibrio cholerae]CSC39665.1 Uncharacterised protein [Vibrio cholerae]